MSTTERGMLTPSELSSQLTEKDEEIRRLREELARWEEEWDRVPKRDDTLFSSISGTR